MSPPAPSFSPDQRSRAALASAGIFLATLLAYWPALGGGFIWDDDAHVTPLALRSLHGLGRIWVEPGATQQYYPLLHSAFWVEHRLWGDTPFGYHLCNILLHATAACLVAAVLRGLAIPGAWLAAFIFALHPVGVESVAWIAEQKNTLSTVFYLLSALTYLRWRDIQRGVGEGIGTGGPPVRAAAGSKADTDGRAASPASASASARPYLYFLALGLFALALLSKSVTATLPAALLVIFWWQSGRLAWKRDVIPLLPWFAVGAVAGLFTAWVERTYIGAQGAAFALSGVQRCLVAGRAIGFYLGKLFWPANLIFIYPHWTVDASQGWQYLFPLGVTAILVGFWLVRGQTRAPLAGMLFFVGSLFPALGFLNVYPFLFSYVADHWQYVASLGIVVPVAAGLTLLARRIPGSAGWAGPALAVLLAGVLGALTWRQCGIYRDAQTLYRTTLAQNPACWLAHLNLGNIVLAEGRVDEAVAHYLEAERLEPDYPSTHFNLAKVWESQGREPDAIREYEQTLRLAPGDAVAHNNLGIALARTGRTDAAAAQFAEALRLVPGYAKADANFGVLLAGEGRTEEAVARYEQALRLSPDDADVHTNLGLALRALGRSEEAAVHFQKAAELRAHP
jgi:Flp pilus assembly protein TadD